MTFPQRRSKGVGGVLGVGLLLVVLGAVPVAAAPCLVPSSAYPTIQAAVNDATCNIINVAAGTYNENVVIDRKVMIGGAGEESTIIDGSGSGPVFSIGNGSDTPGKSMVTITGVTIQNGRSDFGAGISNSGTLTVTDSTISGNTAVSGGAIDNAGPLTILNSTISGNSATAAGGAIHNGGSAATLTVINSTISGNTGG